jgi:hypothetical protein
MSNKIHDVDSITKEMLRRGSTITEADISAVLKVFFEVVTDEVCDGNSVNLPLVNIRPGISGVFASVTDSFDPSRHLRKANLTSGTQLMQRMAAATVTKISQPTAAPSLIEFLDITTQAVNSILTPGGIGQIVGEELKFSPGSALEGIFVIDATGVATQVTFVANRTEGKLMFAIPPGLAAGNYTLEVRKGYGTANPVVRSGSLQDMLQVT